MNQEDFLRLLETLSKAGWDPQICDTEIPIQHNPVYAGNPNETGDDHVEYIKFPKALLSLMPEIMGNLMGPGAHSQSAGRFDGGCRSE